MACIPCHCEIVIAESLHGISTLQEMGMTGCKVLCLHEGAVAGSLTCVMLLLLRSSWHRLSNEYTPVGICMSAHCAMCKVCRCGVWLTSMLPAAGVPAPSTELLM